MPRVKKSSDSVSSSVHSGTSATSLSSANKHFSTSMRYKNMYDEAAKVPRKKAVSRGAEENLSTPATTLGFALNEVQVPDHLIETGLDVKKVSLSSKNGTARSRVVTISPDRHAVFLTHTLGDVKPKKAVAQAPQQQPREGFNDDDKEHNIAHTVASKLKKPMWTPSKGFSGAYLRYVDVADITHVQVGAVCTQAWEDYYERKMTKSSSSKLSCKSHAEDDDHDKVLREQMVTIWHHGNRQSIPMLIADNNQRRNLCESIISMMEVYESTRVWIDNEALLLRYIWYDVDTDRNGGISCGEFGKICQRINLYLPHGRQMYHAFCKEVLDTKKDISYRQCVALLQWCKKQLALDATAGKKGDNGVRGIFSGSKNKDKTVEDRRPTTLVWNAVFGEDVASVSPDLLWKKFLIATQGESDTTLEDAASLINSLRHSLEIDVTEENEAVAVSSSGRAYLTKDLFGGFLHSVFNDAYDPDAQQLPSQKLDRPITQYWINSSHNTYLLGDQLQSRSSVEAYMQALLRGTKCLELDCWDGDDKVADADARMYNGKALMPIVYHGHTLTSKIPFEAICRVVQNYLESHPDTYPIVLSLENHCSHVYQLELAKIMRKVFQKNLYIPPAELFEPDSNAELPSPESLRGCVVIKGKRPPEPDDDESVNERELEHTNSTDTVKSDASKSSKGSVSPLPKIVPELAMLTLFHGVKFKSFDQSIAQPKTYMHSIGESKISKILNRSPKHKEKWRKYNQQHMTRTYPAGTRVDSSNYNPILPWYVGCQLVALNFQTADTPLLLNDGRFRQNGGCGYILKPPDVLLEPLDDANKTDEVIAASSAVSEYADVSRKITIQVLSGSCLPKPQGAATGEYIDPFVRIELHDVVGPERPEFKQTVFNTTAVNNNGFCPLWGKTSDGKAFRVHSPSVAMFLFSLVDDDVVQNDRVADAAIPVSCLRPGYRSIQLYGPNGTRSGPFAYATLLVKITISNDL